MKKDGKKKRWVFRNQIYDQSTVFNMLTTNDYKGSNNSSCQDVSCENIPSQDITQGIDKRKSLHFFHYKPSTNTSTSTPITTATTDENKHAVASKEDTAYIHMDSESQKSTGASSIKSKAKSVTKERQQSQDDPRCNPFPVSPISTPSNSESPKPISKRGYPELLPSAEQNHNRCGHSSIETEPQQLRKKPRYVHSDGNTSQQNMLKDQQNQMSWRQEDPTSLSHSQPPIFHFEDTHLSPTKCQNIGGTNLSSTSSTSSISPPLPNRISSHNVPLITSDNQHKGVYHQHPHQDSIATLSSSEKTKKLNKCPQLPFPPRETQPHTDPTIISLIGSQQSFRKLQRMASSNNDHQDNSDDETLIPFKHKQ